MRPRKYTREILLPPVQTSTSYAQVFDKLGIKATGGNYRHIQKLVRLFDIDTSHFTGMGWSKGQTASTNSSVATQAAKIRRSNEEILIENSPGSPTSLRRAMLATGFTYACAVEECQIGDSWLGKPITLHIDHINGINNDNRPENLRFICPNCHQQTPTWGKHKK